MYVCIVARYLKCSNRVFLEMPFLITHVFHELFQFYDFNRCSFSVVCSKLSQIIFEDNEENSRYLHIHPQRANRTHDNPERRCATKLELSLLPGCDS